MALGTPVAGAVAYSANNGTSVAPAYPSGVVNTDQLVLFVGQKPGTAGGGTVTSPAGWTLREELTDAGGYGTTTGADVGNTNLRVYTKDVVDGTEAGSLSVTLATNSVSWAFIVRVPTGGGEISYGTADGQRTTAATASTSITLTNGASPTNFQAGDIALWAMCIASDVTTPAQFSSQSITATGATFSGATELNEPDSANGNDIGGYSAWAQVASGSSTTAPTVTTSVTGTLTNVRGPVVLLRLRETALPPRTGTFDVTEVGGDSFSADGGPAVQGSLSVSESGADTFSASGVVTDAPVTGDMAATESGVDAISASGKVIVQAAVVLTESGEDSASASGKVLVQGAISATESEQDQFTASGVVTSSEASGVMAADESGADAMASTGAVLVRGSMDASEAGADTVSMPGQVFVRGALEVGEAGQDSASGAGAVVVAGPLSATELTGDAASATGGVLVAGAMAATESGSDSMLGNGGSPIIGVMAATESGADTLSASGSVQARGALAATESGQDQSSASGSVVVSGALAAAETGSDTASMLGQAWVSGALEVSEPGSDAAAISGRVAVAGSLAGDEEGADQAAFSGGITTVAAGSFAANESGEDVAAIAGQVVVSGGLAAQDQGSDIASASGQAIVSGALDAIESGSDAATAVGGIAISGDVAVVEQGGDTFQAAGRAFDVATGVMSASESGQDGFGGYVEPGYVEPGYVRNEVTGTVGSKFEITGQQALLLRRLCQLHGLIGTLEVGQNFRRAGDLEQSVTQSGGTVVIETVAGDGTFSGSVGKMIEELAALHGLTAPLEVTSTGRQAGNIAQVIASGGGITTITRQ